MKDIDNQEWKGYVTQCISGEWPVPPSFVSDKNNWVCRAIVGRVLYFIKDTEGAMRVLHRIWKTIRTRACARRNILC